MAGPYSQKMLAAPLLPELQEAMGGTYVSLRSLYSLRAAEMAARRAKGEGPHANDIPAGFSVTSARHMLSGVLKYVKPAHYQWLLAQFRSMPPARMIGLDAPELVDLRKTKENSGIGLSAIFMNAADVPPGLTARIAESILKAESPARLPAYWAEWMAQRITTIRPDAAGSKYIGPVERRLIERERLRTGMGIPALYAYANPTEIPAGFEPKTVVTTLYARKSHMPLLHYEWLKSAYAALPDTKKTVLEKPEIKRTRKGPKDPFAFTRQRKPGV